VRNFGAKGAMLIVTIHVDLLREVMFHKIMAVPVGL
jgi:hypothetical protein